MYVFILDDSSATVDAAASLMQTDEGVPASRLFMKGHPASFSGMEATDLAETYWLGHMHHKEIGEFTLNEFVDKFTRDFETQFGPRGKLAVQHLYLVGCEIGLTIGQNSAAQVIADLLYERGFQGCQVHAVINPPQTDAAMIVKVVSVAQYTVSLPGEVYAAVYRQEAVSQMLTLQEQIAGLERECRTLSVYTRAEKLAKQQLLLKKCKEKEDIEKEGIRFLETCDITAELRRPHNTCIPNRALVRPEKVMAQELALVQIDQHVKKLATANATHSRWQERVDNFARIVTRAKSPGLKLLLELRQKLGEQAGPDWWRVLENYRDEFGKRTESGQLVARLCQETRPPLLLSPSEAATPSATATKQFTLPTRVRHVVTFVTAFTAAPKPVMPSDMSLAVTSITCLANQLERESRSTFFSHGIKSYKAQKLKELAASIRAAFDTNPTAPNWMPLIDTAMQDTKLVQGMISHRTYDLLNEILQRQRSYERTPLLASSYARRGK